MTFIAQGTVSSGKSFTVGEVKSSLLSVAEFSATVGTGWVLADGQDVTGSEYHTITGSSIVPDMRGQFLRGKNNGRSDGDENPDGDLDLGEYQADEFASHNHDIDTFGTGGSNNPLGSSARDGNVHPFSPTLFTGGNETRAKNITVNHYIYVGLSL